MIMQLEHITKSFGGRTLFKDVTFRLEEYERLALVGPNGAGKTTTIRMIATLLTPTDGDAVVAGHSLRAEPEKVRESITYLPDEAGAYKSMTGMEYLKFMAGLFVADRERAKACVEYAVERCGLGERLGDKIGTYSRGMTRKLLLSRAVMTRPSLAILDEPTSGLDIINALEIRRMIKGLAAEGMGFLLSSHNMLEIEFLSDRVGIIDKGILHVTGNCEELLERYQAQNLEEVFERAVSGR